ncbi:MAG TPA: hypothetical protein VGO16_02345 [Pseudonocardiaceae bacterium]|nr:hypothetical protein [Pseudonocardiaceae bacterium]
MADAEHVARAVADNLDHLGPWMAWAVPDAAASSVTVGRMALNLAHPAHPDAPTACARRGLTTVCAVAGCSIASTG